MKITQAPLLRQSFNKLPPELRYRITYLYRKGRHWAHPDLKRFGTVQDLYYWVTDENLDTVLPIQNYFSVFYPQLDTSTNGQISLFDHNGKILGATWFSLPHGGGEQFRVSNLLTEMGSCNQGNYGTLEVRIEIPHAISKEIQAYQSLYFWDRFYIGYKTPEGQISFVHGVDKTNIYSVGESNARKWYAPNRVYSWAPEIPVDIGDYKKFNVIMLNRSETDAEIKLTLADINDNYASWEAAVHPNGVKRFELTRDQIPNLVPDSLRLRIDGMPTQWGRPIVFKEFHNGAISAMHC